MFLRVETSPAKIPFFFFVLVFLFHLLQLGHVLPEPVDPHTIQLSLFSFIQHSLQTMICPKSLWLADSKVNSSPFFPQSLHSPISLTIHSAIRSCSLKVGICIKISLAIPKNLEILRTQRELRSILNKQHNLASQIKLRHET
jgi:hypothetical protein